MQAGTTHASSTTSTSKSSQSDKQKLCSGMTLKIGDKSITSFQDLSKYFSYYSLIPKLGG